MKIKLVDELSIDEKTKLEEVYYKTSSSDADDIKYKYFDYYIENFIHVLNNVTKWENLMLINKNVKKYHWKTIYNEYVKWSKDGIFELAYKDFLKEHYFKLSKLSNSATN